MAHPPHFYFHSSLQRRVVLSSVAVITAVFLLLTGSLGQPVPVAHAQLTCAEPYIWVSDGNHANGNRIERFTSALAFDSNILGGGTLTDPHDIKVGPDGNIYIANTTTTVGAGSIIQYNPTTNTTATVANVANPFGLTFGPDGDIFVTGGGGTNGGNQVYRIDMAGAPGSFPITPSTFVPTTDGASYRINRAHEGIEFGSDGHLYVVSNTGAAGPPVSHHGVLRFDGTTGAFMNVVLTLDPTAPSYNLRDIIFDAAGNLYLTQIQPTTPSTPGTISRYTITAGVGTLALTFATTTPANLPVGMAFAPDGELYVVHRNLRVNRFNPDTGAFIASFGTGNLDNPKAIALTHCFDWGDLPDTFATTDSTDGARHTLNSDLYLGACVDSEDNGQPDAQAGTDGSGGDDNATGTGLYGVCASAGDDEDGVTLVTPLIANNEACVRVSAHNATGASANLYGWIDFNGDGDFVGDADELLNTDDFTGGFATVPNGGVTNQNYCFTVPAGATFTGGETHMRFRLTTATLGGGTPWAGLASNGEVEDYYTPLACVGNYLWFDTGATPNVQDGTDTPIQNTAVNLVWAGPDGTHGNGDDITYSTTTNASGIYHFCGLRTDANGDTTDDNYRIIVPNAPGIPVTPNSGGDIALDSDGTANGLAADGPLFTVPLPNTVIDNASNDTDPNSYPDNHTDLAFDFGFANQLDFGDLPETGTSYPTTLANDGARHTLNGVTYMGSCVDAEADGQPATSAGLTSGGDDGNTGSSTTGTCSTAGDDEDGVTFLTPFVANRPASFQVTTSGNSCLSLFVDVDGDGTLDTVTIAAGSPTGTSGNNLTDVALTGTGPHVFHINIPSSAEGTMYSRFRLTALCGQGGASVDGLATTGEVEDYVLAAVGNHVWQDDNVDGVQGGGETNVTNVAGLTVSLLDAMGTPVNDSAGNAITTVTDVNGLYAFDGLLPNSNYRIGFTAPPNFGFTPRDQGADALDSDANLFDGRTVAFSVAPAINDETRDAGIYPVTNQAIGNRVWADANNDGILSGETGISGATVRLYVDTGSNGPDAGDVAATPVMQYITDSEGYYMFPNVVPAGNYFVCVVGNTTGFPQSSGMPIGAHAPSGTEEDQSNGDDGVPLGTDTLVCSQTFAVVAGGAPTGELVNPVGYANNNANMAIDFGFTNGPSAVSLSQNLIEPAPANPNGYFALYTLLLALITGTILYRWQRRH